jgi:hypothetical protein
MGGKRRAGNVVGRSKDLEIAVYFRFWSSGGGDGNGGAARHAGLANARAQLCGDTEL